MGWQKELQKNIRSVDELKRHIPISPEEEESIRRVVEIHPMNISRYYMSLIDSNDKDDPIRRMVVPSGAELDMAGTYDTSGEKDNTKSVGLQHKYRQTALILSTNTCASYCRFCFRKRLVGLPNHEILRRFDTAVSYIKKHDEINNVLISGGDPLTLPTPVIEKFLKLLTPISHIEYVRFGTRVPAVFPQRIIEDKKLLQVLKRYSKKKDIYFVTHFNHPREITKKSSMAIKLITDCDVAIENQTVLLSGVNDNPETLSTLFNSIIDIGILPYYVFQCRPVKRVKRHFQIPVCRGYRIFEAARKMAGGHILCKRVKYIMSHKTGKVEIVGIKGNRIYFKYHQAKNYKNVGKLFIRRLNMKGTWLDDFKPL